MCRCRLTSEGSAANVILHRQYKDWISFYSEGSEQTRGLHFEVAFIACGLLDMPPQPLVLLPSSLGNFFLARTFAPDISAARCCVGT